MNIRILTDSACDIPLDYKLFNVDIMNFHIAVDGADYEERVDFTPQEFYKILENCTNIPTTAHITMMSFYEKYKKLCSDGVTDLIHITINKGGSATYDAAVMAKRMFNDENSEAKMNITIIDSQCYSIGYGWPIMQADEMIQNGVNADKVIEFLKNKLAKTEILLATYTLKFMKKSGRISAAAAFAGELMGFRPIITMIRNKTEVVQKVRGDKLVIPALIEQFKDRSIDYSDYIIAYTQDEHGIELYEKCTKEIGYPPKAKFALGCAVAINAGPQSVAIVYLGK